MMATRTTTTRTTKVACAPSADESARQAGHAEYSFPELVQAYFDCRASKRNSASALAFEERLESNLLELDDELRGGTYRPGPSVCFVITRPKPREVWAAAFRDRVVHHLVYNRIADRFHRAFIADSCACIPGRGTLYAAKRLEAKVRGATENWSKPCLYLKADLANFFVSIDKLILARLLAAKIPETWLRMLTLQILMHDPRPGCEVRGDAKQLALIPPHKSLFNQDAAHGLPIGNLSSQFFANVYLNELDQFAKHRLGARHYVRYVDDFVILDPGAEALNWMLAEITDFLPAHLGARLNPAKTIIQPVDRGVDFVGHVIRPWCRCVRKRTRKVAIDRLTGMDPDRLLESANSTLGLLRQSEADFGSRAQLARFLRKRGFCVAGDLTKVFRKVR